MCFVPSSFSCSFVSSIEAVQLKMYFVPVLYVYCIRPLSYASAFGYFYIMRGYDIILKTKGNKWGWWRFMGWQKKGKWYTMARWWREWNRQYILSYEVYNSLFIYDFYCFLLFLSFLSPKCAPLLPHSFFVSHSGKEHGIFMRRKGSRRNGSQKSLRICTQYYSIVHFRHNHIKQISFIIVVYLLC